MENLISPLFGAVYVIQHTDVARIWMKMKYIVGYQCLAGLILVLMDCLNQLIVPVRIKCPQKVAGFVQ
jgi:hypothetical protein